MSKSLYRNVHVSMWGDAKFRALSDDGKILWLYLLTGPETTSAPGCIAVGRASLAEGLDWEMERFDAAFAELDEKGMAKADWRARFVWLPNSTKYLVPVGYKHVIGWLPYIQVLPECELKDRALGSIWRYLQTRSEECRNILSEALGEPYLARCLAAVDTLSDTLSGTVSHTYDARRDPPYRIQDQDQDQDQERSPPTPPQAGGGDEGSPSSQPRRSRKKRELSEEAQAVRAEIHRLRGIEYPPAAFDSLEARFRAKELSLEDALAMVRWAAREEFWGGEVKLAPSTLFRPRWWPEVLGKARAKPQPRPSVRPLRPEDDDVYARLV